MSELLQGGLAVALLGAMAVWPASAQGVALQPVSAFSTIREARARSVALFTEAAKVIRSPRCLNCHPATRQPTQGDDLHAHVPLMHAGPANHGVPGLLHLLSRQRKRRNARILDPQHPGSFALGPRSRIDGVAKQIAARHLPAIEGSPHETGGAVSR